MGLGTRWVLELGIEVMQLELGIEVMQLELGLEEEILEVDFRGNGYSGHILRNVDSCQYSGLN